MVFLASTTCNRIPMQLMHRLQNMGSGQARGGVAAPWAAHLATAFSLWSSGWAWMPPPLVV
jgi:hypothetical protein